jgi:transporter family-2 protein
MGYTVILALLAGVLVALSRQINGRLSLSTSPLRASFWNHIVGFTLLSVLALAFGGVWRADDWPDAPLLAYIGGPLGVIFVAASSWLIARIGAVHTALLVIAGQMVSGVVLDVAMAAPGASWARVLGVAFIFAGMAVARRPQTSSNGKLSSRS